MTFDEMKQRIATGRGFIAALDQSGGSTPKALQGYGISDADWSGDEEMFARIHDMRCRIITSPSFTKGGIIGAILFERTMNGCLADGTPVPRYLADHGVVPFLKVDQGMEEARDGAQLMKPMPALAAMCARARELGVFGTKMRSVIHEANEAGIAANARQQMDVGLEILSHGLVPILEPEVSLKSESRAAAETLLRDALQAELERVPSGQQIMLKLTIPVEANLYAPLINDPRVLRVVALSGGYSRADACRELARNDGMIASFSRALLEELRVDMSDAEFDRVLGAVIDDIARASVPA
ncbi:fructose bisphosphate aldolase [Erythrobacteraceae bacterium CFH 75059]|uniref:fructose bisphosphate aldolase n=1 Tax=Qipengyuania thermophila TaxID=2509361 RepID=UPI0010203542|nr:fructose bisphosphate aldolase [Qipengyuania thermophila]TCD05080.1 fructose bisphosphate aldolase [Erythrobacteraceae bacterium CFH 75059]